MILLFTVTLSGAPVLSNSVEPKLPDLVYKLDTKPTEQFMFKITKPEKDDSTYRRNIIISGNAQQQGLVVKLLRYDKDKDEYVSLTNAEDESYWDIGISGIFLKEVRLPNRGANRIRIVVYRKSEVDKLEAEKNMQISDFTVTLLDESIKDIIKNGILNVRETISNILGSK